MPTLELQISEELNEHLQERAAKAELPVDQFVMELVGYAFRHLANAPPESEPRVVWTPHRLTELSLILWTVWDPLGSGVPPDEYASYAPQVAHVLHAGADEDEIANALDRIAEQQIEVPAPASREAASKISDWYAHVLRG